MVISGTSKAVTSRRAAASSSMRSALPKASTDEDAGHDLFKTAKLCAVEFKRSLRRHSSIIAFEARQIATARAVYRRNFLITLEAE